MKTKLLILIILTIALIPNLNRTIQVQTYYNNDILAGQIDRCKLLNQKINEMDYDNKINKVICNWKDMGQLLGYAWFYRGTVKFAMQHTIDESLIRHELAHIYCWENRKDKSEYCANHYWIDYDNNNYRYSEYRI